jgi:hypothetical protein
VLKVHAIAAFTDVDKVACNAEKTGDHTYDSMNWTRVQRDALASQECGRQWLEWQWMAKLACKADYNLACFAADMTMELLSRVNKMIRTRLCLPIELSRGKPKMDDLQELEEAVLHMWQWARVAAAKMEGVENHTTWTRFPWQAGRCAAAVTEGARAIWLHVGVVMTLVRSEPDGAPDDEAPDDEAPHDEAPHDETASPIFDQDARRVDDDDVIGLLTELMSPAGCSPA